MGGDGKVDCRTGNTGTGQDQIQFDFLLFLSGIGNSDSRCGGQSIAILLYGKFRCGNLPGQPSVIEVEAGDLQKSVGDMKYSVRSSCGQLRRLDLVAAEIKAPDRLGFGGKFQGGKRDADFRTPEISPAKCSGGDFSIPLGVGNETALIGIGIIKRTCGIDDDMAIAVAGGAGIDHHLDGVIGRNPAVALSRFGDKFAIGGDRAAEADVQIVGVVPEQRLRRQAGHRAVMNIKPVEPAGLRPFRIIQFAIDCRSGGEYACRGCQQGGKNPLQFHVLSRIIQRCL
ncbi:hypothetical protein SDC9_128692 [bioreactor metagenome]|uniref:Uncharacterized protein n=1 Tax=bioreactor metagenome TaxID=1076179 RepID=A0A645CWY5_9ZZZZ